MLKNELAVINRECRSNMTLRIIRLLLFSLGIMNYCINMENVRLFYQPYLLDASLRLILPFEKLSSSASR